MRRIESHLFLPRTETCDWESQKKEKETKKRAMPAATETSVPIIGSQSPIKVSSSSSPALFPTGISFFLFFQKERALFGPISVLFYVSFHFRVALPGCLTWLNDVMPLP